MGESEKRTAEALLGEVEAHGDRAAVVPIGRLDDLARDMEELGKGAYHTGFIDWAAKRRERFQPVGLGFEARSIVIVASHSPICTVHFTRGGKRQAVKLPPTYADVDSREAEVARYVGGFLAPKGFHAVLAEHLPHKLLAVRAGLGEYGRNNICYVGDWGSFVNLFALYTDVPCGQDPWRPAKRMERCAGCEACAAACPTGAIDEARAIINAEICVTAMNECGGEFPAWLRPDSHTCLVGCLSCRARCPQNSDTAGFILEGCEFDERETRCILEHRAGKDYPGDVAEKLKGIGMDVYRDVLPRNLAAVLRL